MVQPGEVRSMTQRWRPGPEPAAPTAGDHRTGRPRPERPTVAVIVIAPIGQEHPRVATGLASFPRTAAG